MRAADTASLLISIWQPGYAGGVVPLLALLGTIVALVRRAWRPAILLGLASIALLFISAALVGNVSRYRYPVDPPMAVLAAGAVAWAVGWIRVRRPSVAARTTRRPVAQVGEGKPG